jgi:hypothetical protein
MSLICRLRAWRDLAAMARLAPHSISGVEEHADEVSKPRVGVAEDLGPGLQNERGATATKPLRSPIE